MQLFQKARLISIVYLIERASLHFLFDPFDKVSCFLLDPCIVDEVSLGNKLRGASRSYPILLLEARNPGLEASKLATFFLPLFMFIAITCRSSSCKE